MTVGGLLWANRLIYLLLLVLFGAFAVILYFALGWVAASYVAVSFAVLILRDLGYYRRSAILWPALEQVLDWNRVEELAITPGAEAVPTQ